MPTVKTMNCPQCGEPGTLEVPDDEWKKWDNRKGPMIQDAMPSLTPEERDQILIGLHPECSDAFYGDDNDDEYVEWVIGE